jgi:DNA-binding response OmpR family regulator
MEIKGKIFLIHWNDHEAEQLADTLRAQGWLVDFESADGALAAKAIVANPPDVVVVMQTRLPSHGRRTGEWLRSRKALQQLPIVFVDGEGDALEKTKAKVPNAQYTSWAELPDVLTDCVASPKSK